MFTLGFAHVVSESQQTRKVSVADLEGGWGGVYLNPPLRLKYLIFMENFQKNQETLINDLVKLTNHTPLYEF